MSALPGIGSAIAPLSAREWYFNGSYGSGTDTNSRTFSGVSFGRAETGRVVVVAVADVGHSSISAVTIGGVAASRVAGNTNEAAIWSAVVPTGTTGTVTMTCAGSGDRTVAFDCYSIYGLASATPTNNGQSTGGSVAATWGDRGVVIAVARGNSSSAMSGVPQLDKTQFIGNIEYIIGGAEGNTGSGSTTISCTSSARLVYASF